MKTLGTILLIVAAITAFCGYVRTSYSSSLALDERLALSSLQMCEDHERAYTAMATGDRVGAIQVRNEKLRAAVLQAIDEGSAGDRRAINGQQQAREDRRDAETKHKNAQEELSAAMIWTYVPAAILSLIGLILLVVSNKTHTSVAAEQLA